MTLEERLKTIEQKAINDKAKEIERENEIKIKTENALKHVQALTPRIEELIILANKCITEGIKFPSSYETKMYGYGIGSYSFEADGFYHHVGFMDAKYYNCKKIEYIGFYAGGACGPWDFYTNGKETFVKHENDGTIKAATLGKLQEFLNEFNEFEEAFYKWIDTLV